MTVKKRKKVTKYRGSNTHGGGSMKKRRGAGHRGGRGMAGSGKRADAKKPTFQQIKNYFGVHGFTRHGQKIANTKLNVGDLDQRIDNYVRDGLATQNGKKYSVDLKKLSISKLLGAGKISKEVEVTVYSASSSAIDKIKKAGGNVTVKIAAKSADAPKAK